MYVCMLYVYMYISMYDAYKLFIYIQITYTTKTHVINDYTISVERILMFSDQAKGVYQSAETEERELRVDPR